MCCIPWASAQNLIFNPGFDSITQCPSTFGGYFVSLAPPWESAGFTPDLFNTCGSTFFMVPHVFDDYQPARSGGGYAGFVVYCGHPTLPVDADLREYITAPLKKTLSKDKQYYLEFYVNVYLNNSFDFYCYTDAIGLAFSSEQVFSDRPLFNLAPAIEHRGSLVTDTMNWTRVSGCYRAKGDERFAVLGSFRRLDEILVQFVNPDSINKEYQSYLFCEDVGVWAFDPLPDTLLLCPGESKILNASFLEASYTWSDGSTDSTLSISREGIYRVSANMGECILSDTVVVIRIEEQAHSPTDTLVCQGEKITLSAPFPGTYAWSTGATSSKIEIVGSGMYTLTITNECGDFTYDSYVKTEVCDCPIYVPNVFSPDGDGVNDELLVFVVCDFPFSIKRFQVFDRWGELVYVSVSDTVEDIRWDGLMQGKPVSSGVYTWCLEYIATIKGQAKQKTLQGDITILR
jgi:gliding motility-associated-like protein